MQKRAFRKAGRGGEALLSPAPTASRSGAWSDAAPLPVPGSEMAWATGEDDRMHIIGGHADQQAPTPITMSSTPALASGDRRRIPARGEPHRRGSGRRGHLRLRGLCRVAQNRIAIPDCYAYVVADDHWHALRPLSRGSRGAISVVAFDALVHAIGGRDVRSAPDISPVAPATDARARHRSSSPQWLLDRPRSCPR